MVLKLSGIADIWLQSFENDVKMYGTQAYQKPLCTGVTFENDVKMYGTQAYTLRCMLPFCLRMM